MSVIASAGEGLKAGDGAAKDQRMDVMRALIGVHRFQIHHVAHDVIFLGDAVAAMHVARFAGDVQRLATAVALYQRDVFRRAVARIKKSADPQAGLKADIDLGMHVGQLQLDQLVAGKRTVELLAVEGVAARRVIAELRRAEVPHAMP